MNFFIHLKVEKVVSLHRKLYLHLIWPLSRLIQYSNTSYTLLQNDLQTKKMEWKQTLEGMSNSYDLAKRILQNLTDREILPLSPCAT